MVTYECKKCGMSVNAICWKCDEKMLNNTLEIENNSVQISKCPNGHRKIKSLYAVGKTWYACYGVLNFLITEIFGFYSLESL